MKASELTEMGFTATEQVEIYGLVAMCYDHPTTAPRKSWERAARLVRGKRNGNS